MTDQFDRAQQLEEMQREIALKKHRTFKAVSRLYCEYCEFPLLRNQQPIERDYFLFYHLEHAHPYTEDFLEIAKRYFR